ncbi:Uncharacterised protein at_DN1212 [Pycnogonum litorale]
MWIAFGQGAKMRWIPVHEVVPAIGLEKARGIPYFHAFTGCDVVSAFRGKAKKSAWQTCNVFDDVSETFTNLSQNPTLIRDLDLQRLERFVVLMYDRSSAATGVGESRLDLFARKQRPYNSIPPTQADVREHAKRAAYQAGIIGARQPSPIQTRAVPRNGVDTERRYMADMLDNTIPYCSKLSGADEVFL